MTEAQAIAVVLGVQQLGLTSRHTSPLQNDARLATET